MGALLDILGDHSLDFQTPTYLLKEIENRLRVEIKDGNLNSLSGIEKTDSNEDMGYFTPHRHLSHNWNKHQKLVLLTNCRCCPEVQIFRNSLLIGTNFAYAHWRSFVFQQPFEEGFGHHLSRGQELWPVTQEFARALLRRLGGQKLLFLADQAQQEATDIAREGGNLEDVVAHLHSNQPSASLQEVLAIKSDSEIHKNWFYEEIQP